ncbi:hypothetical protein PYV61_06130, partial [Roseisolibacter sp. H3M3-2]
MSSNSRTSARRVVRVAHLLAASAAVAACGDVTTAPASRAELAARGRASASTTTAVQSVALDIQSGLESPDWSMPTGGEAQFGAIATDASGQRVTGRVAVYRVVRESSPGVVRIDSLSGRLLAFAQGTFQVAVSVDGVSSTPAQFSVVGATVPDTTAAAPAPTTTPTTTASTPSTEPTPTTTTTTTQTNGGGKLKPAQKPQGPATSASVPPVGTGSVALGVWRFDGGSGAAVVSSGVPLAPGRLFPGQEGRVRVVVGAGSAAAEAAVYAAGLHSRHADGSLRAVLVQFRVGALASGAALPARLDLDAGDRPAALVLAAPL